MAKATTTALVGQHMTDQEQKLMVGIISGMTIAEAGREAGFPTDSLSYSAARRKVVQIAMREARDAILREEMSQVALGVMRDLMKDGVASTVRFSAAKWVLEAAGHGSGDVATPDKPVQEMNEAELIEFMAKAQSVIDGGGPAPIIVVTPDNGA